MISKGLLPLRRERSEESAEILLFELEPVVVYSIVQIRKFNPHSVIGLEL